ncbi:C-C motif chemokine 26 [Notamacropus eugenii]|uniref:C-C motif chemokine 26 n=1 Tax=Notamacropus eugenii TaxID=9315 RepID=UPI003B66E90D
MQVSRIVLCVLLSGVLCSKGQAAIQGSNIAKYCCEKYSSRPIPRKLVQTFELTRSNCGLSAVIFITKKGQKVCANPKAEWTQKYVASLKFLEVST